MCHFISWHPHSISLRKVWLASMFFTWETEAQRGKGSAQGSHSLQGLQPWWEGTPPPGSPSRMQISKYYKEVLSTSMCGWVSQWHVNQNRTILTLFFFLILVCRAFSSCSSMALEFEGSEVVARGLSSCGAWSLLLHGMGSLFPDQGFDPYPLHWKVDS